MEINYQSKKISKTNQENIENFEIFSDYEENFVFNYKYVNHNGLYYGYAIVSFNDFFIDKIYSLCINKELLFEKIKNIFYTNIFSGKYFNIEEIAGKDISDDFVLLFKKENFIQFLKYLNEYKDIQTIKFQNLKNNKNYLVPFYGNGILNKEIPFGISFSKEKNKEELIKESLCSLISDYYNSNFNADDCICLINYDLLLKKYDYFFNELNKQKIKMFCCLCNEKNNIPLYKFYFVQNNISENNNVLSYYYIASYDLLTDFKNVITVFLDRSFLNINKSHIILKSINELSQKTLVENIFDIKKINSHILICDDEFMNYRYIKLFMPDYIYLKNKNLSFVNELYDLKETYFFDKDLNNFINENKNLDYLDKNIIEEIFSFQKNSILNIKNENSIINYYSCYLFAVWAIKSKRYKLFSNSIEENNYLFLPAKLTLDKELYNKSMEEESIINPFIKCVFNYVSFMSVYNDHDYVFNKIIKNIYSTEISNELEKCLKNKDNFFSTELLHINEKRSLILKKLKKEYLNEKI